VFPPSDIASCLGAKNHERFVLTAAHARRAAEFLIGVSRSMTSKRGLKAQPSAKAPVCFGGFARFQNADFPPTRLSGPATVAEERPSAPGPDVPARDQSPIALIGTIT
jgi:hypothetical protein